MATETTTTKQRRGNAIAIEEQKETSINTQESVKKYKTTKQCRRNSIAVEEQIQSPKGYSIDIFKDKTNALQYQCVICKQICKHPVELSCGDDENKIEDEDCVDSDSHDVLYCETCLQLYLANNNNECPINSKHANTSYNTARNIRKQINNLYVYCDNKQVTINHNVEGHTGCDWIGKLCKHTLHSKSCTFNKKVYCNICDTLCIENDLTQHNKINIYKHMTLLHQKLMDKNDDNCKQSKCPQYILPLQEEIHHLKSENIQLKNTIKCIKTNFNEWKISYSIESTKKELKLKKQLKKQSEAIELLRKQHKTLQLRAESQHLSVVKLQNQMSKLQGTNSNSKSANTFQRPRDSMKKLNVNVANKSKKKTYNNMKKSKTVPFAIERTPIATLTSPAVLKRANSTRYFHPKGVERYHAAGIHYEMYHPQKSEEVWVSKTIGSMSKIQRYKCCGSAKEGSIYLMLTDSNDSLYVVGGDDKLPKNWNNKMHLGCTKNRKKDETNRSYFICCKGNIISGGCKKRYKCCKKDVQKIGCKTGWGC